ncbi:MAG TPA: cytochrome c oxidase subunit II [Gemmatimonadaceae bacterium]|nr:cytochrome c oxidase subunit II [Gemmatimonadaceae bacterium]
MPLHPSRRRSALAALTAAASVFLAACSSEVPNSTLTPNTDLGRDIDALWDILLAGGVVVFALVTLGLLYVIVRYRHRPGEPEPKQTHGNTALEITWTLIPALVLAFIAVPTVRTIFKTQQNAPADALQIEVIGHQWWWEFRYPETGVITANELFLPTNRTVSFALRTADVLHSFWIPQLAGKRDLISNRTNYIVFTTDSTPTMAWNGFCAEYCGSSHANMRFRVYTVPPDEFDEWLAHQARGPVTAGAAAAVPSDTGATAAPAGQAGAPALPRAFQSIAELSQLPHIRPSTPLPEMAFTATEGDAARGAALYRASPCIACHTVQGVSPGIIGPDLTHVGSRTTIAAGLYPNDFEHLTRWLKDAPSLKAMNYPQGNGMPPMAPGLPNTMAGYDDQQIADLAAYLLSLK